MTYSQYLLFIYLLGCLWVGCSGSPSPSFRKQRTNYAGRDINLDYFNSSIFESQFRILLTQRVRELRVQTHQSFTLLNFPETLKNWIERCAQMGGQVDLLEIKDLPKQRGSILSFAQDLVIDWLLQQYDQYKKNQWFQPVQEYDVQIVYHDNGGAVQMVIFRLREQEE